MSKQVIALLCADIHLSLNAPLARSAEPDWLLAQRKPLDQLRHLAKKYNAPILCAGDVFDHWRASPELINWALDYLPPMYAIPGQHDLPLHNYEDMHKSAFYTLVKAGLIKLLPAFSKAKKHNPTRIPFRCINRGLWMFVDGFPWGSDMCRRCSVACAGISVAILHQYIWTNGRSFPNAPKANHFRQVANHLQGYDVAVFGDNHKRFHAQTKGMEIYNCGALQRRNVDQISFVPAVGLLFDDHTIQPEFLDVSHDRFLSLDEMGGSANEVMEAERLADLTRFLTELGGLSNEGLGYIESLRCYIKARSIPKAVRRHLLESIEALQ